MVGGNVRRGAVSLVYTAHGMGEANISGAGVSVSLAAGALPQRLRAFLAELPRERGAFAFDLDEVSLRLGRRLPDQAQTITYWQRGELGRALRGAGFGVGVEYGRVIFMRREEEVPVVETQAGEEPAGSGDAHDQQRRFVLVVDDDQSLCHFVAEALTAEGYRTRCAADGREALAAVAETQPDLILLDVQMPNVNGWDVLRELRAQAGPHQPIVVMTGRYEGQERALSSGAQGYLAKPFELSDLLECVDLHSSIKMDNNLTERMAGHG